MRGRENPLTLLPKFIQLFGKTARFYGIKNASFGDVQCDQKKSPNVYKSCPKMISLEKWNILNNFTKLPANVSDLGRINVVTGFAKLSNVQ